jgi:hypothetical protein
MSYHTIRDDLDIANLPGTIYCTVFYIPVSFRVYFQHGSKFINIGHQNCISFVVIFYSSFYNAFSANRPEVPKLRGAPWGAPPGGRRWSSGGRASCSYAEHIYFERNMGAKWNIYFGKHFAWFKYFTYQLVPALAPNYKQHNLSPAKVGKVCYSLDDP